MLLSSALACPTWLRTAPAAWRPGTLDRNVLAEHAVALSQQVDFSQAATRFASCMLSSYAASPELNQVMREHARFAFIAFVFFLHHQRCIANRQLPGAAAAAGAKGVTYGGLVALFELGTHTHAGQLATRTRIKAMLGLAMVSDQLIRVDAARDRRQRALAPTRNLAQATGAWLRGALDAAHGVLPLGALPAAMLAHDDFLGELLSYQVFAYIHDHFTLHEAFPAVRYFMGRESGYMTLMRMLQTMRREGNHWICTASPQALSAQYGSARGTIRNVLKEATRQGWIVGASRGGHRLELGTEFAQQCRQWAAAELVWIAGLGNAALLRVRGEVPIG